MKSCELVESTIYIYICDEQLRLLHACNAKADTELQHAFTGRDKYHRRVANVEDLEKTPAIAGIYNPTA